MDGALTVKGYRSLARFFRRPISRRGVFKTGAAVATVVISGRIGPVHGWQGSADDVRPGAPRSLGPVMPPVDGQDPHAAIGRWSWQQERLRLQPQPDAPPRLRVVPIHRAKFLVGQRFDLRVEAENIDPADVRIEVTMDNGGAEQVLRDPPVRSSARPTSLEATWRQVAFARPGSYRLQATLVAGGQTVTRTVSWEVVAADPRGPKAKNIILFIGDGMGQAAITAARIVSKGIIEGKYNDLLEMDRMEVYGHVTTSGLDSIATDSANSASAYATGHKAETNAMGVYPDNTPDDDLDNPRVENIVEMVKRARGMAVGLVTTTDVTDATPAAFFAHTRRRARYRAIAAQALEPERFIDVYMGGGYDKFLPASTPGSHPETKDERNLLEEARAQGVRVVTSRTELRAALSERPRRLWGLFRPGNMNVYLDREVFRDPRVLGGRTGLDPKELVGGPWLDQPTLWEMTEAALSVLEQNPNGFFLMVEGGSIDKQEHPLDWQRAVWDTIEMDKALGLAKRWAARRGDTLIIVTADHNHSMSVVGTHDRERGTGRAGNGVYDGAGFPNFVDSDGDGFPDDPNPSRTLFIGWSNHPDHRDAFQIQERPLEPALIDTAARRAVPNPNRDPDAELQTGNLPFDQTNCVHTVDDVVIYASGPGAARFGGLLDNTEVFFAMADALGLQLPPAQRAISSTPERVPVGMH
jgi:alkaline phosphatase